MKTKLILITFIICEIANAQITITQSDIAGWGDVIRQATDTLPASTIKPGGTGNQTWNFSALNTHLTDTLTFQNPVLLTGSGSFPASNLGAEQKGQSQSQPDNLFMSINANLFNVLGAYFNPTGLGYITIQFNPTEQAMAFPSTYPTTNFTNTSGFDVKFQYPQPGVDSLRFKKEKVKTASIDAYGNVTTPSGTFNTLRQKEYIVEKDTMWLHQISPPMWVQAQVNNNIFYKFSWMANNTGWMVVEMDSMVSPLSGTIQNVKWMISTTVTGVDELSLENDVIIFPNPFSTQTILHSDILLNNATLTVYNSFGQTVKQLKNISGQTVVLSRDNLASGLYFIRLTEGNKMYTDKLVITDN